MVYSWTRVHTFAIGVQRYVEYTNIGAGVVGW